MTLKVAFRPQYFSFSFALFHTVYALVTHRVIDSSATFSATELYASTIFSVTWLLQSSIIKWSHRRRNPAMHNRTAHYLTNNDQKWQWPRPVTLTCKLLREIFSPIYITSEQKADICNSFQVIVQTNTNTPLQNAYTHDQVYATRSHKLAIETGRWSCIPREDRLCPCGVIQKEEHMICHCPLSDHIRSQFGDVSFSNIAVFLIVLKLM